MANWSGRMVSALNVKKRDKAKYGVRHEVWTYWRSDTINRRSVCGSRRSAYRA